MSKKNNQEKNTEVIKTYDLFETYNEQDIADILNYSVKKEDFDTAQAIMGEYFKYLKKNWKKYELLEKDPIIGPLLLLAQISVGADKGFPPPSLDLVSGHYAKISRCGPVMKEYIKFVGKGGPELVDILIE